MAFTPSSRVYLLDTPLDNTNKNQLHFTTLAAQYDYFSGQVKHTFEGVTYQRKNNVARVDKHIDSLWDANYCMYQNTNFGNKWFYAFITKMEYVNENATDVYLETDVYQTWLFEASIKDSFVVREHVNNDAIGNHLVDEQLDTGEHIMETCDPLGEMGKEYFVLAVSDNTPLGSTELIGNIYAHVPTGLSYWLFENNAGGITWLKNTIKLYTDAAKSDAIVMLFTVPEFIVSSLVDNPNFDFDEPIPSQTFYGFEYIAKNKSITTLDGYTPKNNKMFTYPYKFLYVSNGSGMSAEYRYEDFNTSDMNFVLTGGLMPDPKIMLCPSSYRGEGFQEYGLTLSGFPMGSWTTDTYNAWLASNGGATALTMMGTTAAVVGGLATGNLLAVGGGALGIAHQMAQIYQASIQPDQAKGQVGNGNLLYATGMLDFYLSHMSIKQEYAKRIDSYFTMFGYKVNTLKTPNLTSRRYFNYIQTIDVNILGAIPSDDMAKLKKIYNEGVTLWHTTTNFLNYSLNNYILA